MSFAIGGRCPKKGVTNLESGGLKERYIVIEEIKHKQTIRELYRYLRVSRSGYYAYLKRKDKDTDEDFKCKIKAIYEQRNRTVGYRRIQDELYRQYRLVVNHKRFCDSCRTSVLK